MCEHDATECFQIRTRSQHFQSVPEQVRALDDFRALYNQYWLIERFRIEPTVEARQRLVLQPAA